jgi:hypothetical protein
MCTNSFLCYYATRIVFQVDPVREGNDPDTGRKTSLRSDKIKRKWWRRSPME